MNRVFGSALKVGQWAANLVIPYLGDKIGDPKTTTTASEIIMILGEKVTPAFVIKGLVKHGQA